MIVKNLLQIDSTQSYLINLLKNDVNLLHENILISTNNQTAGRGRGQHHWIHQKGSISFSILIKPHEIITLTALEIACHLAHFFENCVRLKWPNDILNLNKSKVGGILINIHDEMAVVGIGLNIFSSDKDEYSSIYPKEKALENLPAQIYQYILGNRLSTKQIIDSWNHFCAHQNQKVTLVENDEKHYGDFRGIGKYGEAIIDIDGCTKHFYNGSLII